MPFESVNPATGETLEVFEEHTPQQTESHLEKNAAVARQWREIPFSRRAELMKRAASILRTKKNEYAITITQEMGKPLSQAVAEVEKSALVCDYYAENAERILSPRVVASDAARSYVRYDPLGSVLAIMPWNFPLWQVFRFAVPNLMAGNGAILKHAPNVPRCALTVQAIFLEAGFPEELFVNLFLSIPETEKLIADDRIHAVTLTGSEMAGKRVGMLAGQHLKKSVLELGGSDPFLVLEDADLEAAAKTAVVARTNNSGQSCISAKRFLVVRSVADEFLERFRSHLEKLRMGDPMDPATQIGPIARDDLRIQLHKQVEQTLSRGGELHLGGRMPAGDGYFYPVTLISRVKSGMAASDEETFGPLAAVITVESEEEAIQRANATRYGLGASLWTTDLKRAERIAPRIEAGSVFVNGQVKSDPRLPFGGIKKSGYGRELSEEGIREFVNIKTVWMA